MLSFFLKLFPNRMKKSTIIVFVCFTHVIVIAWVLRSYQQLTPITSFPTKHLFKMNQSEADESSHFRYVPRPETNLSAVGEELTGASPYADLLDGPLAKAAAALTMDAAETFVLLTAASDRFFLRAIDSVANIMRLMPNRTVIFYDLEENRRSEDIEKIKRICGVVYRKFEYSKYPPHTRTLRTYAFKPIVVAEVFRDHPVVIWFDSSIRFQSGNLTPALVQALKNGGFVALGTSYRSIFEATHSHTFRYLPMPRQKAISLWQREAGHVIIARTREVYGRVVRWWAACALVEDCISPAPHSPCEFKGPGRYAGCHRYDQSALNILLANLFLYDQEAYFYGGRKPRLTAVYRRRGARENLTLCDGEGRRKTTVVAAKQHFQVKRISSGALVAFGGGSSGASDSPNAS